jgi:integrase/recombinase XerD
MQYYDLIEKFKTHLTQLGYSKGSLRTMPNCITEFFSIISSKKLHQLSIKDIEIYYTYLQNRPYKSNHKNKYQHGNTISESYVYSHITALKLFFNWLEITEQLRYNPISAMKFKKPINNERQPLSKAETEELFTAAITVEETALLHIFYSCGLRKTEGKDLNINDINFKQKLLYVREGKFKKRRVIPITAKVAAALEKYYQQHRSKINTAEKEAFFINGIKTRMSGNSMNKLLKKIVERTEISRQVSLHFLRHSIATHLLESGLSIEFVSSFLGHSHLESTQIYTKVYRHQLKKL